MSNCLYCQCDRLAAVREPLEVGVPVICGQCAGLMVLDVDEHGEGTVRRPRSDEQLELYRDPDVRRFLDAYDLAILEGAGRSSRKVKRLSRPTTLHGPDHPAAS